MKRIVSTPHSVHHVDILGVRGLILLLFDGKELFVGLKQSKDKG